MHRRVVFTIYLLISILLMGCAGPLTTMSDRCQGFPFDKKFPGYHKKPLWIFYNKPYCWVTGIDCIRYDFAVDDKHSPDWPYPGRENLYNAHDLPHSEQEKKYLAWYEEREREFDRRYAGWIKKKLLLATEWQVYDRKKKKTLFMTGAEFERDWKPLYEKGLLCGPGPRPRGATCEAGSFTVEYPRYLTGSRLPEGLQTPATFFSPDFFTYYAMAGEGHGSLWRHFAYSLRLSPGAAFKEAASNAFGWAVSTIRFRFEVIFAEYVLTHYYLKEYPSRAEREQVARDLADYYSMVIFRAAGEAGYTRRDVLTARERCAIAEYLSKRIHDYILTAFLYPERLQQIRNEYAKELNKICWDYIDDSRTPTPWKALGLSWSKWSARVKELKKWRKECAAIRKKIEENQERCVNE